MARWMPRLYSRTYGVRRLGSTPMTLHCCGLNPVRGPVGMAVTPSPQKAWKVKTGVLGPLFDQLNGIPPWLAPLLITGVPAKAVFMTPIEPEPGWTAVLAALQVAIVWSLQ